MYTFLKKHLITSVSGMLLLLSSYASNSAEDAPLVLATMQLAPYAYINNDNRPEGYFYDITNAILRESGLRGDNQLVPLKRLIAMFPKNLYDCMLVADTSKGRGIFRYIEPIGKNIPLGILPKAGVDIEDYDALKALTIGVPSGVYFNNQFDKDSSLQKSITKNYELSVKMLLRERFNAIAGNIDSFYLTAKKLGTNPQEAFGTPLVMERLEIWFACAPGRPDNETLQKLKRVVIILRDSGELQRIIDRHLH